MSLDNMSGPEWGTVARLVRLSGRSADHAPGHNAEVGAGTKPAAEVDALPPGEHDHFDRKSGQLFNNKGDVLASLAKAASAFANSGGGHIVLGVDDKGTPDGVPPMQGNTSTCEWLEQQLPNLA